MRRNPIPGILAPRSRVEIIPGIPLDHATETPLCLTRGDDQAIKMTPAKNGAVVLESVVDVYTPYLLVFVEKEAHDTWTQVVGFFRQKLAARKNAS